MHQIVLILLRFISLNPAALVVFVNFTIFSLKQFCTLSQLPYDVDVTRMITRVLCFRFVIYGCFFGLPATLCIIVFLLVVLFLRKTFLLSLVLCDDHCEILKCCYFEVYKRPVNIDVNSPRHRFSLHTTIPPKKLNDIFQFTCFLVEHVSYLN